MPSILVMGVVVLGCVVAVMGLTARLHDGPIWKKALGCFIILVVGAGLALALTPSPRIDPGVVRESRRL